MDKNDLEWLITILVTIAIEYWKERKEKAPKRKRRHKQKTLGAKREGKPQTSLLASIIT